MSKILDSDDEDLGDISGGESVASSVSSDRTRSSVAEKS